MKQKLLNSMRVLLVAAGLCVGATSTNAQTTLYERGGSGTAWSDADLTDWVAAADYTGTVTKSDNSGTTDKVTRTATESGLSFNSFGYNYNTSKNTTEYPTTAATAASFTKTLTGSEVPATNTVLTWTATWKPGNATGTNNNTNSFIKFGDVTFAFYGSDYYTKVTIGSTTTQLSGVGTTRQGTYEISVTINQLTKVVSYTFKDGSKSAEGTGTTAGTFNTIQYGLGGKMPNWSLDASIVSINISEKAAAATADYKVYFKDESNNDIKTAETRQGTINENPVLGVDDKASFYDNAETKAHKYVYKEDNFGSATIKSDGTSEYIITYKTYEPFTYSLKQKIGTAEATEIAAKKIDGDLTETVYYPVCVKADGKYYTIAANETAPKFGVVFSASNKEATITYTEDANIVYYDEAENMATQKWTAGENANNSSNGASYCSYNSANSAFTSAFSLTEAGYYNLEIGLAGRKATSVMLQLKNDETTTDLESVSLTEGGYVTKNILNQLIEAGQEFYIANDNGSNASKWALDYVILRTPETTTATIGTYGYASFSSTKALDFTNVTDATAYIATSKSDDNIVLTSVTGKVAAGTGLVLKSANGSSANVSIPVTDSGMTYNTESDTKNYLFAISSNYTLNSTNTGTNYVLTVQNEKVVFAPIGSTGAAVTAGQAALWIPTAGTQARALNLAFDDETTGISLTPSRSPKGEGSIYTLSGQRVEKPAKGLYIVNGKKVVMK